jgi:diphosphomevalonate decarboxylase
MQAEAVAHPNIALIKYWGKSDMVANLPAVGSISITLDDLTTTTRVRFDPDLAETRFVLDGRVASPDRTERVRGCLDLFRRRRPELAEAEVVSENSFPTAAGLASSASGFAALVTAVNGTLERPLGIEDLAEIARRCSGSSPRSLFGGFVELSLHERGTRTEPLLPAREWPLEVVIAVTSAAAKTVGSTEGMERTRLTSPFYDGWVAQSSAHLDGAREAIGSRDFELLAEVSEASCLAMHAVAMAARPGLVYWNGATVACLHRVRELREAGTAVFFTIDAGPQVKAICLPGESDRVASKLRGVPGVIDVLRCGLGDGARIIED